MVTDSFMSGMQRSNEARGAETSSAECERRGGLSVMAKHPGKRTSTVGKAPVCAKTAGPASTDGVQQRAEDQTARRCLASPVPPEGSEDSSGYGHEVVRSVAELTVIICEDPDVRKKRLKLAEALRERGLNESMLAAMYSGVAAKLSRDKEEGAVGVAAAKLLFDVLKELAHWLEPQKTAGDSDVGEAPQFVRLIHNVPRPVRTE